MFLMCLKVVSVRHFTLLVFCVAKDGEHIHHNEQNSTCESE